MYQHLYSEFLKSDKFPLHMAAHSHHFWPDAAAEAQASYFRDSSQWIDKKWELIFGEKVPRLRALIAKNLNLKSSDKICFAPNTHEFVFRLMSCHLEDWIKSGKKMTILSTDSEFYSFERQARRLEELGAEVLRVPVEPFASFSERWSKACLKQNWSMIFISQVFFNSGVVVDLEQIISSAKQASRMTVVDAYHGFMAVPTDWSKYKDEVYYLAGGYKYAQAGEGACFLITPKNDERPVYTGWFAEFGNLQNKQSGVPYPDDAWRFAGSTMDATAIYRFIASLECFEKNNLSVERIHEYVQGLQTAFLQELDFLNHTFINRKNLIYNDLKNHGHFLTFECGSADTATEIQKQLYKKGLYTDSRGSRLRFGFGLYQKSPFDLKKYF